MVENSKGAYLVPRFVEIRTFLSMNRRAKANTCSARKYVCGVLWSLIPYGCIEPKNLYQILDFRLVGVGVSEWVKCDLVVNHATPETCASSFTIILARS